MTSRTVAVAALWLAAATTSPAADLTKVDRAIRKEPAYQTKDPRYCLLVFGPETKTRVWLVQDGSRLYVDRNANGDLTDDGGPVEAPGPADAGQAVTFAAGDIPDGGRTHTKLQVTRRQAPEAYVRDLKEWARVKAANSHPSIWAVDVTTERAGEPGDGLPKTVSYVANGDGLGFLLFAPKAADAPVIHFGGPWTLGLQDINQRIVIGKPKDLQIGVGTPGVGPGTFAFAIYRDLIPADVYPVADIAFPAKVGGPPVTARTVLKRRC
jgi:hypothetical protein